MSRVTSLSSAPPSGPTSSNDCGRTTPPATTIFIRERTSSSLAMFSALVTTVSWAPSPLVFRSGRTARARATSVIVVPPLRPTTVPGDDQAGRGLADALLLRRVLGALVAQRQVVRDAVGDRATPGPGDHLLLGELVEVAADGGLRDVEPVGRVLDADPAALGE